MRSNLCVKNAKTQPPTISSPLSLLLRQHHHFVIASLVVVESSPPKITRHHVMMWKCETAMLETRRHNPQQFPRLFRYYCVSTNTSSSHPSRRRRVESSRRQKTTRHHHVMTYVWKCDKQKLYLYHAVSTHVHAYECKKQSVITPNGTIP